MIKSIQMREKSLSKGSITVYLTLMLMIMLSFVFTSIEAARITGAKAYLVMLSEMASDSLKGTYYYPLFEEYALLAIDAGYGGTDISKPKMAAQINDKLEYSAEHTRRGLMTAHYPATTIASVSTLLDGGDAGFMGQIRKEVLFEGAELLIDSFLDNGSLEAGKKASEQFEKMEDAAEAAKKVSEKILKLMSAVDGIATTKSGLAVDKSGNLYSNGDFVKKIGAGDPLYMESTYGNPRVYKLVQDDILYPAILGKGLVNDFDSLRRLELEISEGRTEMKKLLEEIDALAHKEKPDKQAIEDAKAKYIAIADTVAVNVDKHSDILRRVRNIYEAVRSAVSGSKASIEAAISLVGELKKSQKEAEEFKDIIGDSQYDCDTMLQTLKTNKLLLERCTMPEFCEGDWEGMKAASELVAECAGKINYDGFKFKYGLISTSNKTGIDIEGYLSNFLGSGILKLIGLDNISEKQISGEDLPSGGMGNSFGEGIKAALEGGISFFTSGDFKDKVDRAVTSATDSFITEVYLQNNFSTYADKKDDTRIAYEREYILFGNASDKENINCMASKLFGIRAALSLAAVFSDKLRTEQAEALGLMIAGLTGIVPLLYVIKYSILTLWALEEAIVEVCALFLGKTVAVFSGQGHVDFSQLFSMTTTQIRMIAESFPSYGMPKYSSYLTFMSLFENLSKRNLRAMDIIQENIRLNGRDSFRIRNCVTEAVFITGVRFDEKFDTQFFKSAAYDLFYRTSMSYAK